MATLHRSIRILAPAERINTITTNGHRTPDWYVGLESTTVDAAFPQVGSRMRQIYRAAGIKFNLIMTVEAYEKDRQMQFKIDGRIQGRQQWIIEPQSDAVTRLIVHFEYQVPGGSLGLLADKLMIERINADNLDKSLRNLKRLIEQT